MNDTIFVGTDGSPVATIAVGWAAVAILCAAGERSVHVVVGSRGLARSRASCSGP
ncbi:hypothetical protein [Nonomuraea sediminis]|uniref:hypothetical protein n=1 Tax=Nonomuraea sediminis TaxID=2835864 RepID=UPI001BDBB386|nr:hypothetical protein [Nonomuraea sediminis]